MKLCEITILDQLKNITSNKRALVTTINAHSYNTAQKDILFQNSLKASDAVLPDGISIVLAKKFLYKENIERITGADLFYYEMNKLNFSGGKCFFLGSTEKVLELIKKRAMIDYPNIEIVTYSPPFKDSLSISENIEICNKINTMKPNLLWLGMTAPKQEKWAYENKSKITNDCLIGCIGAVFDFYAGTMKRAPIWMQKSGLEWLYRFFSDPRRLWKRYLFGNFLFVQTILKEKKHIQ